MAYRKFNKKRNFSKRNFKKGKGKRRGKKLNTYRMSRGGIKL